MDSMVGSMGPTGGLKPNPTGYSKYGAGRKAPSGYKQFQNFTPEMMDLFQNLFGMVGPDSYLSRLAGGDQSLFEEMEAPAMRQFGQLQGDIANRFSGAGMGARHGSGFNVAQNTAAQEFAQNLQSNRQNLQRQALMDMMGFSNMLLGQQPYSLVQKQQKQPGFLDQIMGGIGNVGGQIAPIAAMKYLGLF